MKSRRRLRGRLALGHLKPGNGETMCEYPVTDHGLQGRLMLLAICVVAATDPSCQMLVHIAYLLERNEDSPASQGQGGHQT